MSKDIFERIVEWNIDRNIPQRFVLGSEIGNITEEVSEICRANNPNEIIDGLADIIVFCTGAMWKYGYEPTEVMNETLKEIESRGGKFDINTGKWKKEINGNEHKANYDKCRRFKL